MSGSKNCPAHGITMFRIGPHSGADDSGLVVYICPEGDLLTMQHGDGLLVSYSLPNLYEQAVERHERATAKSEPAGGR